MLTDQLTDRDRAVLDFEARTWRYRGRRDAAILETFGWSATRHAQVVLALIDQPAALEYAPVLVNRLRRVRDARARVSVRRVGWAD